jgi:hypothetical protein
MSEVPLYPVLTSPGFETWVLVLVKPVWKEAHSRFDTTHTLDFEPFIKSQLARTQLTFGRCVVQIWSRYTRISGVPKPS